MNRLSMLVCMGLAIVVSGCTLFAADDEKKTGEVTTAIAKVQPSKAAATQPANQNVTGTVKFVAMGDGVHVTADLTGLSPGKHGFHIHDKGDLSAPDLSSVGPHYNPGAGKHGAAHGDMRHAGDLGNIEAGADGKASYNTHIEGLKLADIIGKSVIVHAKEDDLKSDPSGNSGGRIAGGVIEAGKSE